MSARDDLQMSNVVTRDTTSVGTARTLIVWNRPYQLVRVDGQCEVEVGAVGGWFWKIKVP